MHDSTVNQNNLAHLIGASLAALLAAAAPAGADEGSTPETAATEPAAPQVELERAASRHDALKNEVNTLRLSAETTASRLAALEYELSMAVERNTGLEHALDEARAAATRAEAAAEDLRAEVQQLEVQCQAAAREHDAQLQAAQAREGEQQARLRAADARIAELEQQLQERAVQIAGQQSAERQHAERRRQLEERLSELRARLPTPEGGSVTAEAARARAEQDAEALRRLVEEGLGIDNPQLWQGIREAENALHRSQYLLARADDARTVYRLRPGDSLARVSAVFYGNTNEWSRIFEANRHVLDDPNRVLPGMTLVIP